LFSYPETIKFETLRSVSNPRSVHGIYPYRGKISAIDARQVLAQFREPLRVLDPFCGSGTIVYEAASLGHEAIGVELNPIAQVLTEGKVRIDRSLTEYEAEVEALLLRARVSSAKLVSDAASRYFHPATFDAIATLAPHFDEMSPYVRACFSGAVCLAARGCNWYKWTSSTVGKQFEVKQYIDFQSKLFSKIRKHYFPIPKNKGSLVRGDARNLEEIPESSIDLVFTSPPYFDCLDYTAYYAKIIYELLGVDRLEVKKALIQKFSDYQDDMSQVLTELRRVVKPEGLVIFVVGDKKIHGQVINGGDFFIELTDMTHLQTVERSYSGTSSKVFDEINKTERKEQIVVWRNDRK